MGMRGSPTAELVFDDCEVPEENVMGPLNGGVGVLMSGLDYERVVLAGMQLGIMQACLDVVLPYVRERKQFGKADRHVPADAGQGRRHVRRAAIGARLCLCRGAGLRCGQTTRFDAAGAILLASENALKVAGEAVQALGGAGYTKDWPVERYPARCQAARHRRRHQRDPPHADRARTDRCGMSAPVLSSTLNRDDPFRAGPHAHNRALAAELRARVARPRWAATSAAASAMSRGQAAAEGAGRTPARSRLAVPRDRPARRQRHVWR
jgi:hypothetical protein